MTRRLIVSTLLLALSAFAQDAKPNLSGTWKLNAAKSDFGPMPAPDSRTDTITHKEPVLKESVDAGDFQFEATYTTDGKESKNTMMGSETTSKAHWDGSTLVIDTKVDFNGSDMVIHGTMTLSADGKVLTRKAHFSGPMGDGTRLSSSTNSSIGAFPPAWISPIRVRGTAMKWYSFTSSVRLREWSGHRVHLVRAETKTVA